MKIYLENMLFYANHGVYEAEKQKGNMFSVDIELEADLQKAASSDNLNDTLNYEQIYDITAAEMKIRSNLLENVAERIFIKINHNFPQITSLKVKVSKHNPPFKGRVEKVSVEMQK